jgi:hypothetical protein
MRDRWHRVVLAGLATVAVFAGATSVLLNAAGTTAAGKDHVIEILHSGFNPTSCLLNRADTFRFLNKTDEPQRVLSKQNQFLDSGPIEPGATSKGFNFHFIGSQHFYLESNPQYTGSVTTDHGTRCDPLPPTPTPTNTPTPTPTAIPTPEGRKGLLPSLGRE